MRLKHRLALGRASDAELAVLALEGDRPAFGEMVRRAAPRVHSLLRRMGAQAALADDLTQDAMIAALNGLSGYRGDGPFANWAMTIAARLYIRRFRRDARTVLMAETPEEAAPSAEREGGGLRLDLDRALAKLSAPERLCVSLCHGVGLTHEEIAASLDIPLGTVKSHVLRGLKKLRVLMAEADGGAG
jgi:RNA polymerase sigma-70 factor (ECF subfamily)